MKISTQLVVSLSLLVWLAGCASKDPIVLESVSDSQSGAESEHWICTSVGDSPEWFCAPDELSLVAVIRDAGINFSEDDWKSSPQTTLDSNQDEWSSADSATRASGDTIDGLQLSKLTGAPEDWVIQVAAFRSMSRVEDFIAANEHIDFETYEISIRGSTFYSLILSEYFESREEAQTASDSLDLAESTSSPWIRTVRSFRAIVVER